MCVDGSEFSEWFLLFTKLIVFSVGVMSAIDIDAVVDDIVLVQLILVTEIFVRAVVAFELPPNVDIVWKSNRRCDENSHSKTNIHFTNGQKEIVVISECLDCVNNSVVSFFVALLVIFTVNSWHNCSRFLFSIWKRDEKAKNYNDFVLNRIPIVCNAKSGKSEKLNGRKIE